MVDVGFAECERLVDAKAGPPEDDDQAAQTAAMRSVTGGAQDGDDLFDGRRVGRIAQPLNARWSPGMESGHRRGRTPPTGCVEQNLGHDPFLGLENTSLESHTRPGSRRDETGRRCESLKAPKTTADSHGTRKRRGYVRSSRAPSVAIRGTLALSAAGWSSQMLASSTAMTPVVAPVKAATAADHPFSSNVQTS